MLGLRRPSLRACCLRNLGASRRKMGVMCPPTSLESQGEGSAPAPQSPIPRAHPAPAQSPPGKALGPRQGPLAHWKLQLRAINTEGLSCSAPQSLSKSQAEPQLHAHFPPERPILSRLKFTIAEPILSPSGGGEGRNLCQNGHCVLSGGSPRDHRVLSGDPPRGPVSLSGGSPRDHRVLSGDPPRGPVSLSGGSPT